MSKLLLESKSEQYVDLHFKAKEGRTWKIQNWNSGDVFGVFHSDTSSFVAYLDSPGNLYISAKGVFGGEVWTPGLRLAAYGDGAGISLYGGEGDAHTPQYGLMFAKTANFGCYGQVTGDWATYFTMDGNDDRGWIFRLGSNNVASIGSNGIFDAKAYVGRCNGVTNSIFSQNEHYTHYNTDAPNGHWFNTDVRVQGRVYCGPNYGDMCMSVNNTILSGAIGGSISINSSGQTVFSTWLNNMNYQARVSVPSAGWYPVCYVNAGSESSIRGLTEFVGQTVGGSYTPYSVKVIVDICWSAVDANIYMLGASSYVTGARVTKSSDYIFIELHFTTAITDFYINRVDSAVTPGNRNTSWVWYNNEALPSPSNFGATTIVSNSHATGISTSHYLHQRGGYAVLDSNNYSNYAMPTGHWAWSGQNGQPAWVWGGNNFQEYRVWNPANFNVFSAGYTRASHTYTGGSMSNSTTAETLFANGSIMSCGFMEAHPLFHNYADVLYFSGYDKWGGTQMAFNYNAGDYPMVAIRKYTQSGNIWGNWNVVLMTNCGTGQPGTTTPGYGIYGYVYYQV